MANILVVDDDPSTRSFLTTVANILGHSCVAMPDGREALDEVLASPPDLIITDVRMPGMDGFQFLHEVRRHTSLARIPALVYTGVDDADLPQRAMDCDALMVLPKLSEARTLISAIRSALEDNR